MIKPFTTDRMFLDLKSQYFELLEKALMNNPLDGYYTKECEKIISQRIGRKHVFLAPSGTLALTVCMLALGIGPGDEVICPNYSYVGSVNQVKVVGADCQFVDVDRYGHIDVSKVQEKINSKTKAIIVVGLYGDNPDLKKLSSIAKQNNVSLINDAAQSSLSLYDNQVCDSFGDLSIMSFGGNKVLSTFATYGCVCTDSDDLAYKIKRIRVNGKLNRDHDIEYIGINAQAHEDKAVQVYMALQNAEKWITRRVQIADYYDDRFAEHSISYRRVPDNNISVRQKYVVFFNNKDKAFDHLLDNGIESQKHYRDNFSKTPLSNNATLKFPWTEYYNRSSLSIPIHAYLTDSEVEKVTEGVIKIKDA